MDGSACYSEKNVSYLSSAPLAITQVVTRTHWAGKSGIKSGAAEPYSIAMAMVEKPLLLLHIFLSAPSIGSGIASQLTMTLLPTMTQLSREMLKWLLSPSTLGVCVWTLPIEGAEVPLHTMQSAMLQSVHSGSGMVPCTKHYSTLPHYPAQRGLALNTYWWMLLSYNLTLLYLHMLKR